VDGILRLARSSEHEPVNVGNPTEFTILECARRVMRRPAAGDAEIKFEALRRTIEQRRPDIRKRRGLLDGNRRQWQPGEEEGAVGVAEAA